MKKLPKWVNIIVFVLVFAAFSIFLIKEEKENAAARAVREPLWKEIEEYQPTIKPEMIISIKFAKLYGGGDRYTGKPIIDWKLDELALAMASVPKNICIDNSSRSFGYLTIEIDTTGTEIEPDVSLRLVNNSGVFDVCFSLFVVMQDSESYAYRTFGGKELIEWAKSIGIADDEDWGF